MKDLNLQRLQIDVDEGKGDNDRRTMLPRSLIDPLQQHLDDIRRRHEQAMRDGVGGVILPHAAAAKYPKAEIEFGWHLYACTQEQQLGHPKPSR